MRNLVALVLISALLASCSQSPTTPDPTATAAFSGSSWMHDKKCASCAYTAEYSASSDWMLLLLDTSKSPAEVISIVAGGPDEPLVSSMARLNDVIYYTNQYGLIVVVDLADPRQPVMRWNASYSNNGEGGSFDSVRIEGSRLIARFLIGNSGYYTGSGVAEWDIKHNPFSPRLISYTCLLYTSDAADERSSVDLGGRRIIK